MKVIGIGCILLALVLAFVGIYFCLYGGIVQAIQGFSVSPLHAGNIAFGIVRVLLTMPCLWGIVLLIPFSFIAFHQ